MATSSLFEECQVWINKGQESWKSFFSKWENLAKEEENTPESELILKVNDKCKLKNKLKNQIHKKVRQPCSQKKLYSVIRKRKIYKQKKIKQKKKVAKKTIVATKDSKVLSRSSIEGNLIDGTQNNQIEKSLRGVFTDLLKTNRNNYEVLTMLYQTFSERKRAVKNSEYILPEQNHFLIANDFKLNMEEFLFEKRQIFSSYIPRVSLNTRSICPSRHAYIQSLNVKLKATKYKSSEGGSSSEQWRNLTIGNLSGIKNYYNNQQYLASVFGDKTSPPSVPKLNLEVKSCPSLFSTGYRLQKAGLKSIQLDFNHEFQTSLRQQINKACFKNIPICKMSTTQEGKRLGTSCLHKRTNSVSLRMGNSNFISPERKSSEQKCFNKIVSQKRRPSKKLFFHNEEDDSESDDQAKYRAPLMRRQNKRQKVDEPEAVVESDSDDCDALFDRIVKA